MKIEKEFFKTKHKGHGGMNFSFGGSGKNCCSFDFGSGMKNFGFAYGGHYKTYQKINDGNLEVYILAPGIDKTSLKIRAKQDKLTVRANHKDLPIFKDKELHIVESLNEDVIADDAKAKYSDGVLLVTFPLSDPGFEVSDVE